MTAQIPDLYTFQGREYAIIAISDPIYLMLEKHGFHPSWSHTACWRGYWCEYDITPEGFFLGTLHIHQKEGVEYPVFCNREAQESPYEWDNMKVYTELHYAINYTGSVVIGDGFIDRYYAHMDFQPAWAYEKVIELKFKRGIVFKTYDYSDYVARMRKEIELDPENFNPNAFASDPKNFVTDAFPLHTKNKAWWI